MDIYSILISTSVVFFLTNAQKLCNDNVNTEDCIFECDYKCTSNGCNITRVYCGNFTQELNKTHCVHTCSPYCSSGICNQTSGKCAIGCIQGFYGDRCQYLCPHDCIACSQLSGQCCPHYCRHGRCEGEIPECVDGCWKGKYGLACQQNCSENCNMGTCDQFNGTCLNGCTGTGLHLGPFCNESCSHYCQNGNCDKNTLECLDGCLGGTFGQRCEHECPANCFSQICSRITGSCSNGCKQGFFEKDCSKQCPSHCENLECNLANGKCVRGCVVGFFGDYCENHCSGNCRQSLCSKEGACSNGCESGYYKNNCSESCPKFCNASMCDRQEGLCTFGCSSENITGTRCGDCVDGKWGKDCSMVCPINCNNSVCAKHEGLCLLGCKGNFEGRLCEKPQGVENQGNTSLRKNVDDVPPQEETTGVNVALFASLLAVAGIVTVAAIVVAVISFRKYRIIFKQMKEIRSAKWVRSKKATFKRSVRQAVTALYEDIDEPELPGSRVTRAYENLQQRNEKNDYSDLTTT